MEKRKGYVNYLINGCKVKLNQFNRFYHREDVQIGARLFFLGIGIGMQNLWFILLGIALPFFRATKYAGLALFGALPAFTINKEGATGENLALLTDLEKRMQALPAYLQKEVVDAILTKELETRMKKFEHLGDLDDAKLKKVIEFIGDDDKGIRSILLKQGQTITELTAKLQTATNKDGLTIRQQVEDWYEVNKAARAQIKAGEQASLKTLEVRVNSPMTNANTLTSTVAANNAFISSFQVEPGINDIVRVQPTFWDYIRKGRTSAANYIWVNKKNPLGAAGFIGPGVLKPGISFELGAETSIAKKIAVSDKASTELLQDVEGMTSYIQQEMAYKLQAKMNTTLMTGVASNTVPAGISTISVAYSLVGVATDNPNNYDVIRAVVAQLRSGNLVGAVTVFVNPVDKANMDLTKAISQGQLFNPAPLPATIVEDNNIPVGYFQAAILEYYRILIYKDYVVTYGFENDDFTKNLVTVIAEMRIHQFFSENYTGAFVYDTFANVKSAIANP